MSRYPGKATRWWRCPVCRWVGFDTRSDDVPIIGRHLISRPRKRDAHMTTTDPTLDPRFIAGVELLERTGAKSFRIGWSHEDDGPPTVWYAVAEWEKITAGPTVHRAAEAAGALTPLAAVMRLCEQVIDGGECTHCHLPTIFVEDTDTEVLDMLGCVYAWDPELATFRRSCEGDAP